MLYRPKIDIMVSTKAAMFEAVLLFVLLGGWFSNFPVLRLRVTKTVRPAS